MTALPAPAETTQDAPEAFSSGVNPLRDQAALWTGLLVLLTLIWGNSFLAVKQVVTHVSPLELVTVRFVPVALTFAPFLLITRSKQVWGLLRTEGWRLALLGLTGAVLYNAFMGWGQLGIGAGTASLIVALNPAFTYLLSIALRRERFAWARALGLLISFGGLYIVIRWGSGRPLILADMRYGLITVMSPIAWSIYTVAGKPLVERYPPLTVTGIAMTFAGVFSLLFLRPSLLTSLATVPPIFWWSVLFLAWPCTVFGFVIWFAALERMPASRVVSFVYLVPLFGVTFGRLLLDEPVTPPLLVGAAVLIVGVWLVNRRANGPARHAPATA